MLRFATSVTEQMTIDALCEALLNYIVAKQNSEGFVIHIDDIRKSKNSNNKDSLVLPILKKFAIREDSVFYQSEYLHIYHMFAAKLIKKGKAFVCRCDLIQDCCRGYCKNDYILQYNAMKQSNTPFVVRIEIPFEKYLSKTDSDKTEELILLDANAKPSRIFAQVCNDMLTDINIVIEVEKTLFYKACQKHIASVLEYNNIIDTVQVPRIIQSPSVISLLKEGYIPDAIINYLLLLMQEHAPQEIFTLPEAIEWFDINRIPQKEILFEIEKLAEINRRHLEMMDNKALSQLFGFADEDIGKLAKLYLEQSSTTVELQMHINRIFGPKNSMDLNIDTEYICKLARIIQDAPMFLEFDSFLSYIKEKAKMNNDVKLMETLGVLIGGTQKGPKPKEIYPFVKSYLLEVASC